MYSMTSRDKSIIDFFDWMFDVRMLVLIVIIYILAYSSASIVNNYVKRKKVYDSKINNFK